MPSSEYPEAVLEYVQSQGWTTDITELREGAYIIAGFREGDADSERMLLMVVCDPEDRVTADHMKYLLKAGQEKNVDSVRLTHTVDVTEKARKICDEYGVSVIGSQKVQSYTEGNGLEKEVDTDEISIPSSESETETQGESEDDELSVGEFLDATMSAIFTLSWVLLILFTLIGFLTPFSPPVFDVSDDIQGFLSDSNEGDTDKEPDEKTNSPTDELRNGETANTDSNEQADPATDLDESETESTGGSQNDEETNQLQAQILNSSELNTSEWNEATTTVGPDTSDGGELVIGELARNDTLFIEVTIEEGKSAFVELRNRDADQGLFGGVYSQAIYRSAQIEEYEEDDFTSPFAAKIEPLQYGEYGLIVVDNIPTDTMTVTVTVRYRIEDDL